VRGKEWITSSPTDPEWVYAMTEETSLGRWTKRLSYYLRKKREKKEGLGATEPKKEMRKKKLMRRKERERNRVLSREVGGK